jgi:2'-5' RNA ligase
VNPQNVSRIRQALTEVFGPSGALQVRSEPSWREDHSFQANGKKIVHFRLNAKAGRQLLEHAPDKVVSTEFLSQLTRAQLELFYQVSIDADGTRRPGGKGDVIAQKDKARLDAFQVACALTGRAGVVCGPNSRGMYHMSVKVTPWVKPKGHKEYVSDEVTDLVWCVQTPNKSWFARRNGTCYFTGNTTEQSSLQLIDALRPWLCRLELAFFDLLPARRVVRFNTDALLKTDLEARTNIYQTQRNIGLRTIDELRELEGLEPLPQGIGQEAMPLVLMNAMATRAGGIPKTLLPSIALEMDLAADRLENLEKIGLGTPDAPPPLTQDAATFLAGLVNINRSYKHNEAGQAAGQLLQNIENRLRQLEEDRAHPVQVPELHVHNERPESVPDAQQKQDNWRQYVDGAMKDLLAKKDAPQIPEVHVHLHDRAFPDTPGTGNNPAVAPPAVPVNKPALDKDATEDTDIDNTPGLSHDSGMISLDVPHGTLPHPDGGVGHHHVTLAYLGDHVSDDELAAAKGKAHEVASTLATRPEADIGGPTSSFHGTKNNPGKRVDYAPVTNPSEGMHELHDRLSPLNKSDYADQDWTPHVTLKYSDPSDSPVEDTPVKHVKFTHITVKRGDETTQYPFADDLSDEG